MDGTRVYKVKWRGYSKVTWEPAVSLDAIEPINEYEQQNEIRPWRIHVQSELQEKELDVQPDDQIDQLFEQIKQVFDLGTARAVRLFRVTRDGSQ